MDNKSQIQLLLGEGLDMFMGLKKKKQGDFRCGKNWLELGKRFSSVQLLSHVQLFATPWTAAHQASWSITNSRSLLKFTSTESVMPSNHLILCRPLLLLHSIFPSISVFSNVSLRIRWPNYWSFSCGISLSNEYLELISFMSDWFDLFASKGLIQEDSQESSLIP